MLGQLREDPWVISRVAQCWTKDETVFCDRILDDDRARCWSILKLDQVLQHGAVVLIQPDVSELDHWSSELSLVSTNCSTSPAISMARDESV